MKKNGRKSSALGEIEEYCRAIKRIKPLTREEEVACATALRDTGDQKYVSMLVNAHLVSVVKFAMKYGDFGFPIADIIQEGNIGLVEAARKFDVSRGYKFITYARWRIRARIHAYLRDNWRLVKIKHSDSWENLFNIACSTKEMGRLQRQADEEGASIFEVLGKKVGVSTWKAQEMLFRFHCGDISIDWPIFCDSKRTVSALERSFALFGIAIDGDFAGALSEFEEEVLVENRIDRALETLPIRERVVVNSRYLCSRTHTLEEIGKRFGLTKERIRQIESGAIEKLRKYLTKQPNEGGKKDG